MQGGLVRECRQNCLLAPVSFSKRLVASRSQLHGNQHCTNSASANRTTHVFFDPHLICRLPAERQQLGQRLCLMRFRLRCFAAAACRRADAGRCFLSSSRWHCRHVRLEDLVVPRHQSKSSPPQIPKAGRRLQRQAHQMRALHVQHPSRRRGHLDVSPLPGPERTCSPGDHGRSHWKQWARPRQPSGSLRLERARAYKKNAGFSGRTPEPEARQHAAEAQRQAGEAGLDAQPPRNAAAAARDIPL